MVREEKTPITDSVWRFGHLIFHLQEILVIDKNTHEPVIVKGQFIVLDGAKKYAPSPPTNMIMNMLVAFGHKVQ